MWEGCVKARQLALPLMRIPMTSSPPRFLLCDFVSQRVQDVVTYEAVLEVANEERKLRPGMTAVADIVTTEIRDALLVPNAALRFTPDDDSPNAPMEADESLASRVWRRGGEQTNRRLPENRSYRRPVHRDNQLVL